MISSRLRVASLADVTLLPAFILWFIWQLQFTARWTWVIFIVWMVVSFFVHRDTPKSLGWTAGNLAEASKRALGIFALMALGLILVGIILHAPSAIPSHLIEWRRLEGYFAFCLLQQVALNSLLHNRMLSLIRKDWLAAVLTGSIFAACHWPNPVLVPLTFIAGTAMAWMFGKARNIIPLAIGQAILGTLVFWAFPLAWQHHMRVGPGYYSPLD
ncbi:MAG TPA: CPBP family glutamic-type intramembrane protease [Candidatus Acidoferrum sp.]|nr:CPBP family glutamic-type intramembrane protease [Candidatus Acidoferrum sp.]